jgi:hypothetical protein
VRSSSGREATATRASRRSNFLDVVADVRAFPERRIAAAVALSATDDDAHRRRIRAAAHACADDELRAVIELAAEGEIDEAALDRMRLRYLT